MTGRSGLRTTAPRPRPDGETAPALCQYCTGHRLEFSPGVMPQTPGFAQGSGRSARGGKRSVGGYGKSRSGGRRNHRSRSAHIALGRRAGEREFGGAARAGAARPARAVPHLGATLRRHRRRRGAHLRRQPVGLVRFQHRGRRAEPGERAQRAATRGVVRRRAAGRRAVRGGVAPDRRGDAAGVGRGRRQRCRPAAVVRSPTAGAYQPERRTLRPGPRPGRGACDQYRRHQAVGGKTFRIGGAGRGRCSSG